MQQLRGRRSRRQWYLYTLIFFSCLVSLLQFHFMHQVGNTLGTQDDQWMIVPPTLENPTSYTHENFTVDFPLCLVHIGKAGGSSISCGLGLTYADCEGMPREKLPNTSFFHMRRNRCPAETTRTYVVTVRNPITRIISWFEFEKDRVPNGGRPHRVRKANRQRARLFKECYSRFEDLASEGLQPLANYTISASNIEDMTCSERAWAAILGVRPFSYHEWYNYEYYWTELQNHRQLHNNGASIKILRSEHLSDDWSKISTEALFRHVNRGVTPANQTVLSDKAIHNLCRALCPEIQIYKKFLGAGNLLQSESEESIQELSAMCPLETIQQRHCSDIPTFPLLHVPIRLYNMQVKKRLYTHP